MKVTDLDIYVQQLAIISKISCTLACLVCSSDTESYKMIQNLIGLYQERWLGDNKREWNSQAESILKDLKFEKTSISKQG